jgi:hypothetical protein
VLFDTAPAPSGLFAKFSEDQSRDDHGRFAGGDGDPPGLQQDRYALNGKPFSFGVVDLRDGHIEETIVYAKAEEWDFHHSFFVSPEKQELIDAGTHEVFWIEAGGVPTAMDKLPAPVIGAIKAQIEPVTIAKGLFAKFSEDQPRDDAGRFASGVGGGSTTFGTKEVKIRSKDGAVVVRGETIGTAVKDSRSTAVLARGSRYAVGSTKTTMYRLKDLAGKDLGEAYSRWSAITTVARSAGLEYDGLTEIVKYSDDQPRGDDGRWGSGGPNPLAASARQLREARALAVEKFMKDPPPTPAERDKARAKIEEMGSSAYHTAMQGNSTDRENARLHLLREFGDGMTCPCVHCGLELNETTVTRDHLYPSSVGGSYRFANVVPACIGCNIERSDTPFKELPWVS